MNIAVIGAGISGLCAAFWLSRKHNITLMEANDYLGGHTNTVEVDLDGERHAIDTGFIVFNDRTYPSFIALLDTLGVVSQPTEMSFSVRCEQTGLEYQGSSLGGLFAQRANLLRPRFWRMLRDIAKFNREGTRLALAAAGYPGDDRATVGDFLRQGGYGREFAEHYLLPMGSAIWSCPVGKFADFPLRMILEFFHNHGLLSLRDRPRWRVIAGGAKTYVAAVAQPLRGCIRLATPIERITRHSHGVEVVPRRGPAESFDHVVLACHADQALRMLSDPSPAEREVLGTFPYERNVAVLHTDASLLPRRRRAWASWNYHLPRGESTQATVTYCMNILQGIRSRQVLCVTLNSEERIDPSKVLRRFEYDHPVFSAVRTAARARQQELLNHNRTSFCGAYWGNGFHEDGVVSAMAVCRALEATEQIPAGSMTLTTLAPAVEAQTSYLG